MPTNVSSVVNHFPSAEAGFTTTLASTILSAATTVPLNSVSGYTNGEIAVFIVDPADAVKKQVFTGTIDTAGVQVTGVVWTSGTNQTHTAGSTVVDYVTATHISMVTKGLLVSHDQDGTLKAGAVDNAAVLASDVVTTAKILNSNVTTAKIADANVTSEKLGATIAFRARRSTNQSITGGAGFVKIDFATEDYDYGSDYDAVTNFRFTAPLTGVYVFDAQANLSAAAERTVMALYKDGAEDWRGADYEVSLTSGARGASVSGQIQLTAGSYVEAFILVDDTASVTSAIFSGYFIGA